MSQAELLGGHIEKTEFLDVILASVLQFIPGLVPQFKYQYESLVAAITETIIC